MMARRLLIHVAALLVGTSLGLGVGWLLHTKFGFDSIVVAVVVTAFVFLFQVLANLLAERMIAPPPPPVREPTIRGTEPWGWLRPANGIGAGFQLNKDCIRLGRGVDMDILLNNASISRRHAQFRRLADGCRVEDIGSRNGIFVNGIRVQEQTLIDGDTVTLGEVKFVFHRIGSIRTASSSDAARLASSDEVRRAMATSGLRPRGEPTDTQILPPRERRKTTDSAVPREQGHASPVREARPFDETSDYSEDAET